MRYRDYARNAGKKTEELTVVEQAEFEHLQQRFEHEVRTRLTGTPIDRVELLQYGDAPQIEPGELLGRIVFALPEGADPADLAVRKKVGGALIRSNLAALQELRKEFGARGCGAGAGLGNDGRISNHDEPGPVYVMTMKPGGRSPAGLGGDQPLTPVMARLGQEDLETLDALIAAGIASSRADAVRWTLARIRERPAYEQIRARSREIEDLKSQF